MIVTSAFGLVYSLDTRLILCSLWGLATGLTSLFSLSHPKPLIGLAELLLHVHLPSIIAPRRDGDQAVDADAADQHPRRPRTDL